MRKQRINQINVLLAIFSTSYLSNLLWEVAHSLLYDWNKFPLKNDIFYYIPKILRAALADAVIICFIFLLICLFEKSFNWIHQPKKKEYLLILILGFITAVFIEIRAKFLNLWDYNEYMPLVFSVGLTPLIQLSVTGIIALSITNRLRIAAA